MKLRPALSLLGTLVIVMGCASSGATPSAPAAAASPSAEASQAPAESAAASPAASAAGTVAKASPGQAVKMMLLPKFLGILPFDQANKGA
ncbi:MAG: hypothetical protein QOJ75_2214, partial [Chloroflexota bacterium]|nr:hypothetical protein [Chloroflexota bacterium]